MKRFVTLALVPFFAGFLGAQETKTETTTTTTFSGVLVDAACRTTHTENRSTETTKPTENSSKTTTTKTNTETTECPVTTTSTSFGLMTADGKFVRFDDPGNSKVIEVVKSKKWDKMMEAHKPVKVQVVGTANGDVVVIKTIQ